MLKKEQVEHVRLRALAQAIVNKEKGKDAFEEYLKIAFPWLETQKKRDYADHIQRLMSEVKRGGLGVRPLWEDKQMRSRLKTTVVERTQSDKPPENARERMNALYKKLGKISPV